MTHQSVAKIILEDFLKNSRLCLEVLVKEIAEFEGNEKREFSFFQFKNGKKHEIKLSGKHFFLRSSVEYSNPQLTVEEVQGIIAA